MSATKTGAGRQNKPQRKCISCPKIFVNTCVDHMYSIKLTWKDLMNGNGMDIQQVIGILLQSLTLVTTAHHDWIQFLPPWCLLRNNRDCWWHSWMFKGEASHDWPADLLAMLEIRNKRWDTLVAILKLNDEIQIIVAFMTRFFLQNYSNWNKKQCWYK